jgi:hypothetical protein
MVASNRNCDHARYGGEPRRIRVAQAAKSFTCSLVGQERDELADAALVLVGIVAAGRALVHQPDAQAGVQERQLAQAIGEDVVVELESSRMELGWAEHCCSVACVSIGLSSASLTCDTRWISSCSRTRAIVHPSWCETEASLHADHAGE